jgi:hypothetical protein
MGKMSYLGKAKHYAEKIRLLNDHGHDTGYKQAQRYFWMLGDVMKSASDHNSLGVPLIHAIYVEVKQIMDEWGRDQQGHKARP